MKYLIDRNFRTLFLVGMGIYFIVEHENRERPQSPSDLINLSGRISHYSFEDNTGWRGIGRQYYVFLDEYPNKFQISANYLTYFNKARFELNFQKGSRVKLSIPKYQEQLIGSEEPVFLNSLSVNALEYLNKKQTLDYEKTELASNSGNYLGTVFIVAGILSFVFYDQMKKA